MTHIERQHYFRRRKRFNQRAQLRRLHKAVEMYMLMFREEVARRRLADLEREKRNRDTDYRSVCRCRMCRFREWYRYRSGETYPGGRSGRSTWRLPFAGRWPRWR